MNLNHRDNSFRLGGEPDLGQELYQQEANLFGLSVSLSLPPDELCFITS